MTNKWQISVPGRVNLIGEHIDYHNLPVLPMAIQRRIQADVTFSGSSLVEAESAGYGTRQLRLGEKTEPGPAGDWANYLKAAVLAIETRWRICVGFHVRITSDLPSAAGLSSSTALLTAFTLGLLKANNIEAGLDDLMSILPEGEHFVGTRGGGMDHAAVLASRIGHASLLRFAPFSVEHVPIPANWRFLVAHSLTRAEKSGAAKARYNACRIAGLTALEKLGLCSFWQALNRVELTHNQALLPDERDAFLHVVSEADRVKRGVLALQAGDRETFGDLLNESHTSLRDRLQVSCPALDQITAIANSAGAFGARLTGAGFGGCALILCAPEKCGTIVAALERHFYARFAEYQPDEHLIVAEPSNGALYA